MFFCTQEARIVIPITLKTINLPKIFGILANKYGNHKTYYQPEQSYSM